MLVVATNRDADSDALALRLLLYCHVFWLRCAGGAFRLRTNSEELLPTSLEETLRVMADDGRVNVTRGR